MDAATEGAVPTSKKNKGLKGKAKGKAVKKGKAKGKGKAVKTGTGRLRTGVGATIRALILKKPDRPNKEIAEMALEKHPDSRTNGACVAWYKNDMRKKKEIK